MRVVQYPPDLTDIPEELQVMAHYEPERCREVAEYQFELQTHDGPVRLELHPMASDEQMHEARSVVFDAVNFAVLQRGLRYEADTFQRDNLRWYRFEVVADHDPVVDATPDPKVVRVSCTAESVVMTEALLKAYTGLYHRPPV